MFYLIITVKYMVLITNCIYYYRLMREVVRGATISVKKKNLCSCSLCKNTKPNSWGKLAVRAMVMTKFVHFQCYCSTVDFSFFRVCTY